MQGPRSYLFRYGFRGWILCLLMKFFMIRITRHWGTVTFDTTCTVSQCLKIQNPNDICKCILSAESPKGIMPTPFNTFFRLVKLLTHSVLLILTLIWRITIIFIDVYPFSGHILGLHIFSSLASSYKYPSLHFLLSFYFYPSLTAFSSPPPPCLQLSISCLSLSLSVFLF